MLWSLTTLLISACRNGQAGIAKRKEDVQREKERIQTEVEATVQMAKARRKAVAAQFGGKARRALAHQLSGADEEYPFDHREPEGRGGRAPSDDLFDRHQPE